MYGKNKIILALLGICTLLYSCAVNPVTQEKQLMLMSKQKEKHLGKELYPKYTQLSYGLYQDEQLQDYVQKVGQKLARISHRPNLNYQFNVVNDSKVNAYALPGGKISITRGMLTEMDNEAQLAAVLGHEIGHVAARHAAVGYTRKVIAGLALNVAAAGLQSTNAAGGDLLLQGGQLATNLLLMHYSRKQERQADSLGMEYMVEAGYNPQGMIQLTEILKGLGSDNPSQLEVLFSTHPPSKQRYAAAKQKAQSYSQSVHSKERLYLERFQKAVSGLREDAPAYELMDKGLKLAGEEKYFQALKSLRQATEKAPNQALIWIMKAAVERKAGQEDSAYHSAKRAVQRYPDLFYARYMVGITGFAIKRHRKSLAQLHRANQILPNIPKILFYIGRNHEAMDQREKAAQAYYQVLKKVKKGEMAQYCAQRLRRWGYIQ